MMIYYQFPLNWNWIFLPLFLLLSIITTLGIGLWMASLNVKYRDFRYIVPFIVQFGLYISPVGFSTSIVPDKWKFIYFANPVVGVIDGFRWAILGSEHRIYLWGLLLSIFVAIVMFLFGLWYFRKMERTFADIV